jgi:hypothetical protein
MYVILGGGIAGLYSAYQLLKKNPDQHLVLIEKDRWGGRIFTYTDDYITVEAGAGRFSADHTLLLDLIHELHLHKKIVPISSDAAYAEPTTYNLKFILAKIIGISKLDVYHDLTQLSFLDYAKLVVSAEEVTFIEDSFGYYTELVSMNARDAMELMFQLNSSFFILKGGLSQIINALMKRLATFPNVQFKKEEVLSISKEKTINTKYVIRTNKNTYTTSLCICALPSHVLSALCKPLRPLLKYIVSAPLCRIYCTFEHHWFKHLSKLTTKSPLRILIPSKKTLQIYMDNKYADFWHDLYLKRGMNEVNKTIQYYLQEVLQMPVPKPLKTKMFYWEKGVGYWTIGAKKEVISKQIKQPFPNFYVCGENYSATNQQWMEGALETSRDVCNLI